MTVPDIRKYFKDIDVNDQLLNDVVNERDIVQSSQYIEDLARNYGVDPRDIPKPTPFKIARLAMFFCLMQTALEQTLMSSAGQEADDDAYEKKRKLYASLVADLESQLTADTFLGGISAVKTAFPATMKIYRS